MKVKEEDLRRELLKAINGEDLIINCARRLGIRLDSFKCKLYTPGFMESSPSFTATLISSRSFTSIPVRVDRVVYAANLLSLNIPTIGRSKRSRSSMDLLKVVSSITFLLIIFSSNKTITNKNGERQGQKRTLFKVLKKTAREFL